MIKLNKRITLTALIFIATLFLLILLLNVELNSIIKFILAVISLTCAGTILQSIWNISGFGGLMLLRTQRGVDYLDKIARLSPTLWKFFADSGLVFGFGLFSIFLFPDLKKNIKYYAIVIPLSLFIILLFFLFAIPHILPLASSLISGIDLIAVSKEKSKGLIGDETFIYLSALIIFVGGFAIFSLIGLFYYSLTISIAVLRFIFNSDLRIKVMEPGASLLLPGINLPLWEGIIALLVLLFVHETAHGILSRVSKIRVDSAGLVLFGIIPVGAFIEPNESELLSADNLTQKRVLIAGSAANFVFSIFSFFILSIFVILSSDLRQPALYILSGNSELESGAIIRAIDSQPISENFELPKFSAGQKVRLLTDKGEKTLIADENGRLGVLYVPLSNHGIGWRFVWKDGFESLNFIYSTIALLFLLNFIVGVVNLLPLPFFDGQRIFELSVNDKRIVNAITAGVTAAFLLNFLPWLFK